MDERRIIKLAEQQMDRILRFQVMDPQSEHWGGVIRQHTGLPSAENAGGTPADLVTLVCLYLHSESAYYHDHRLIAHMEAAIAFIKSAEGRDGLISMDFCNFDSPPDTAFVVGGLAELYCLIRDSGLTELDRVGAAIFEFLENTRPGLAQGGVHTPNHRWVMSAALLWLDFLFNCHECRARAMEWLAEGIDCSKDGEWSERSNGIYNVLCDVMFFQMWHLLDDESMLEPVRRNIDLVSRLIHPGGLLVTDYSNRQDRLQPFYIDAYYLVYQLMAGIDHNKTWSWRAREGARVMGEHGTKLFSACTHELLYHMRYPQWMQWESCEGERPMEKYETYVRQENGGYNLIRNRQDDASLTLISELDMVGSFVFGKAHLIGIRPTLGFFGKAVVKPANWTVLAPGHYQAHVELVAPYFAPLSPKEIEKLPDTVNPLDMYNSHRREIDTCRMATVLTVITVANGFDLTWTIDAEWPVFAQMALMFDQRGHFAQDLGLRHLPNDELLFEGDKAIYEYGSWRIEVTKLSPGAPLHQLQVIRGDVSRSGTSNLLINSLAPHDVKLQIRGYR